MFEIGSYVIYRAEGVCVISDIRKENFGSLGNENEYYILTPVSNKSSTVFVPVSNEKLVSLIRPLMSAIEIERMLDEIRNDRIEWINDSRARNTAFKEILSSGDRRELCVLAITVFEKAEQITKNNKKVCPTDLNALRKAEKMLFDEFRATTDIKDVSDVIRAIKGEIKLKAKIIEE